MPIESRIGVTQQESQGQNELPIIGSLTTEYGLDPNDPNVTQLIKDITEFERNATVKAFVPILTKRLVEEFIQAHP